MNGRMRLGDLDALKEDFKSRLADCNEWIEKAKDKETKIRASTIKAYIGEVLMTIDNAPTVEAFTEEYVSGAYNEGYMCGSKEAEKARPQGEWSDYITEGTLKARHGDYVLYNVDFLLDHLAREVYIMEGARRMRGKNEN